jgi:hypothetical protein
MSIAKKKYSAFCKKKASENNIPIFSMPFWLDNIAENWDVILYEKENKIVAALPFCLKGNLLTKRIYLPDLSFYQSILYFDEKMSNQEKKEISIALFKQLPPVLKSYFKFLPEYHFINLKKLNYEEEKYKTYLIKNNLEIKSINNNHQRYIQKGIKLNYNFKTSKDLEKSYLLINSTFTKQKIKSKIGFAEFKKLNEWCDKHNCGQTIDCTDSNNNLLASLFYVEDNSTIYYLLSGYNLEYKNSGAMHYSLYKLIEYATKQNKTFNFCGSNKKSIAQFFEGFGAIETPISVWKKTILQ